MASRFAAFGAEWCGRAGLRQPLCVLGAGSAALGLGCARTYHAPLQAEVVAEDEASNLKPHHLSSWQQANARGLVPERRVNKHTNPLHQSWPEMNFLNPDELVAGHIILNDSKAATRNKAVKGGCVRANACKDIYWDPKEVKAAIVTCGGLCPGLNSIIREVTNCLHHDYGIQEIYGYQGGYNGLAHPEEQGVMKLKPKKVRDIHMKGGSILKAGRGGMEDPDLILDNMEKAGINMIFTVGGDGTQAAANILFQRAKARGMQMSIVGLPKSIDNDILYFDKTFGFESATATASDVVRNGWVEATSCYNGVGIVKLMGRDAGFVAMNAALASTVVDLVLIPEVPFKMEDVLAHADKTLARKGHMVICVAEGAGQEHFNTGGATDGTGHTVYGDIGTHLRDVVNKHCKKNNGGRSFYIDPSYIIRSCPIRPNDHIFCGRLARDAVHTAMRGYTGVCVGPIHNIICVMPCELIAQGKAKVKLTSSSWQACIMSCKMPHTLSGLDKDL